MQEEKDLASNHQHCKNKGTKVHFNITINTGTRVLFLQFYSSYRGHDKTVKTIHRAQRNIQISIQLKISYKLKDINNKTGHHDDEHLNMHKTLSHVQSQNNTVGE